MYSQNQQRARGAQINGNVRFGHVPYFRDRMRLFYSSLVESSLPAIWHSYRLYWRRVSGILPLRLFLRFMTNCRSEGGGRKTALRQEDVKHRCVIFLTKESQRRRKLQLQTPVTCDMAIAVTQLRICQFVVSAAWHTKPENDNPICAWGGCSLAAKRSDLVGFANQFISG